MKISQMICTDDELNGSYMRGKMVREVNIPLEAISNKTYWQKL